MSGFLKILFDFFKLYNFKKESTMRIKHGDR